MRSYETMYILDPDLNEDSTNSLIEKFKSVITDRGGEVQEIERWGKRRLAYPIEHRKEGYYVIMNFTADPSAVQEMERLLKITTGVLRHIVIRKDR
ncbi:30S ribosomal protein S6 [Thermovenabulum sp.]|uniref:30S ribosomal protein S6 n=1 Tax=Thermovenabulum sp. TaxID=3100335 RepID=UPI003C7C843B